MSGDDAPQRPAEHVAAASWLGVGVDRLDSLDPGLVSRVGARLPDAATPHTPLVGALRELAAALAQRPTVTFGRGAVAPAGAVVARLDEELERCARYRRVVAVIVLDLDVPLSIVGGAQPPVALADALSDRLRSLLRGTDLLGRVDARGFVVVCPETDRIAADQLASRLVDAIGGRPLAVDGGAHAISARAGVSASTGDAAATVLIATALEELRAS